MGLFDTLDKTEGVDPGILFVDPGSNFRSNLKRHERSGDQPQIHIAFGAYVPGIPELLRVQTS